MKGQDGRALQSLATEIESLRAALAEREALLDLSARLALGLLSSADLGEAIARALAELGQATGVDRVYLFEMRPGEEGARGVADQTFEWVAEGIEAQIDNPDLQGLEMNALFPRLMVDLVAGRAVAGPIESFTAEERTILDPQGIQSILIAPVVLDGRFWGFLGFDSVHSTRRWSSLDTNLLKIVAATLGAAVQRLQMESELRRAASVFESTRDAIAIVDPHGVIVSANQALLLASGYSADELAGQSWSILVDPDEAQAFGSSVAEMLRSEGHWRGECNSRRRDGKTLPLWLSVNLIRDARGRPAQYVAVATDVSQLKASEARLDYLAHHDALTGLPNRRRAQQALEIAVGRAAERGRRVAALFVDLDRFKGVNDSLGHPVGDELLVEVVKRLRARLRGEDLLARFGGDEFLVILQDLGAEAQAVGVAQDLCERLRDAFQLSGGEVYVAASIGISLFPDHAQSAENLVQKADVAMYRAKQAGRDQVRVYSAEMGATAVQALALETRLRRALERDGLKLHYQPRVDLRSGRINGAEALLRVDDGDGALLPPGPLIALAESIGLIVPIGRWVLQEACRQALAWHRAGLSDLAVAVNVSARQFYSDDLLDTVDAALAAHPISPDALEIELTESVLMDRPDEAGEVLRQLRGRGIRLALDDFGSGYSSLSYLMRFPVDRLKIDHQFVADLPTSARACDIAGAIVALGHQLELMIVAEGVENSAQQDFLQQLGVDEAQGFLFSAALEGQALVEFVRRWKARSV